MHSSIYVLCFLLVFTTSVSYAAKPEVRSTCAEHFLNGHFRDGIYPIGYGSQVFNLECVMPKLNAMHFPVEMTIRNALEKEFELMRETKSVGYQVSNWDFLKSIIELQDCEQNLQIDWKPVDKDAVQAFRVVTISGKTIEYVANLTNAEQNVLLQRDGVLHLAPSGNSSSFTARITASPLRCRQTVVPTNCVFELSSASDKVSIPTSSLESLSFAFRTDKPNLSILRLVGSDNSVASIRLQNGYLLYVNSAGPYPVGLLADGHYHTLKVDLNKKFLQIDSDETVSISGEMRDKVAKADILVNGTVANIRLNDGEMECAGSAHLQAPSKSNLPILRKICGVGEPSFCNCNGPSSLFPDLPDSQCEKPSQIEGFTFQRNASKASFFYFNEHQATQSVSVVFKSTAGDGLVMVGQRKAPGSALERYQVYFTSGTFVAGACLKEKSGQFACKSCEIKSEQRVENGDFIRVSLFNTTASYTFLTVDNQICKLTANHEEKQFGTEEFFKSHESDPFLFVGGAFYADSNSRHAIVKEDFKANYLDLSVQKPKSLRGCLAEIRLDGSKVNLNDQLVKQAGIILKDPTRISSAFALEKGCQECDAECGGDAPCRLNGKHGQICDCADNYVGMPTTDGKCVPHDDFALHLSSAEPLVFTTNVEQDYNLVKKMFMFFRVPITDTKEAIQFVQLNRFYISVANYGKTIIIGSSMNNNAKSFEVKHHDQRLHLIAFEHDSLYGGNGWRVRVDDKIESLDVPDLPISLLKVKLMPLMKNTTSNFGGCIEGFYVALEDETHGELLFVSLLEKIQNENKIAHRLQIHRHETCGILDKYVWQSPSSPLGFVGAFDPSGVNQMAGQHDYNRFSWMHVVLPIVVALIILCFVVAVIWKQRTAKKHTYMVKSPLVTTEVEEKRPFLNPNGQPTEVLVPTANGDKPSLTRVLTPALAQQQAQIPQSTSATLSKEEL